MKRQLFFPHFCFQCLTTIVLWLMISYWKYEKCHSHHWWRHQSKPLRKKGSSQCKQSSKHKLTNNRKIKQFGMFYVFGISKFKCNYSEKTHFMIHCYCAKNGNNHSSFHCQWRQQKLNFSATWWAWYERLHWNLAKHCEQTSLKLIEFTVKRIEWIFRWENSPKVSVYRHIICYYHRFVEFSWFGFSSFNSLLNFSHQSNFTHYKSLVFQVFFPFWWIDSIWCLVLFLQMNFWGNSNFCSESFILRRAVISFLYLSYSNWKWKTSRKYSKNIVTNFIG